MWSDIFSFHYVCTYIFIYVCTYPSLFTHTCTYMFIHIYMHRYARIHISNQFHCYNVFSYCAGQVIHFDMNMATLPAASLDIRCIEIKQVQQASTTNIIQIDIAMMMLKKIRTQITQSLCIATGQSKMSIHSPREVPAHRPTLIFLATAYMWI